MQSKKRFTETNIWDDPVFMELTPHQKLCWYFINDRCDNIGVWTPNPKLIAFNLDIEESPRQFLDDFLQAINSDDELIKLMASGDWLIRNFVKFQYCKKNPLHPNNSAHKSYLQLIEEKNLLTWFCENFPEILPESYLNKGKKTPKRPLGEPFENHKEKEKDQEKGKEEEEEEEEDALIKKEFEPTLPRNGESTLEFEMRNKGHLNNSPF